MGKGKRKAQQAGIGAAFLQPRLHLSSETKRGLTVVICVLLAGLSTLSVFNLAGNFGLHVFRLLANLFGVLAYVVPIFLILIAVILFREEQGSDVPKHPYFRTYLGSFLLAGGLAGLIHLVYIGSTLDAWTIASEGRAGGYFGALFSGPLSGWFGYWGALWILIFILAIGVLVMFNLPLKQLLPRRGAPDQKPTSKESDIKINTMASGGFIKEKVLDKNKKLEGKPLSEEPTVIATTSDAFKGSKEADAISKMEAIVLEDRKDWKLPPFDLLDDNKTEVDSGNIENNVAIIQKTLQDFGIDVEMGEVNVGPTVTQYTLRPTTGVKLSQIAALQNDLALALAAHSVRMELPIPGKPLVGIEIPNKATAIVRLREVMQTSDFVNHKSKLAIALGRDVAGRPMLADLAKMPHLLIAGATGTGKSVSINSVFISLLYRNTPQDVKFIVIDPKRVELNLYNGIPHLLTPVVTDHDKAVNALKWAVAEMDRRYKLLAEANKRNILEYNEGSQLPLSYIVILVDELADLMAVAQADVEATIVRLSQMARAVGIHLVLATQRPSVEIITGLIKANITSRIAFAVASQVDSRTILDSSGAEKLLGNGDMLFISAEFTKPKRIQGTYIGEKEVKKVVEFFKQQTGAVIYNEEIVEKPKKALGLLGMDTSGEADDDLFEEAKDVVTQAGKASASLLQRRLRVGYARAARLLDVLEERGIIGPGEGAKPREVYGVVPSDEKAEYGIEDNDIRDEQS
jgi:DNA segregation ATPase FtsK/SpoIIIE, S-DNA-T family